MFFQVDFVFHLLYYTMKTYPIYSDMYLNDTEINYVTQHNQKFIFKVSINAFVHI